MTMASNPSVLSKNTNLVDFRKPSLEHMNFVAGLTSYIKWINSCIPTISQRVPCAIRRIGWQLWFVPRRIMQYTAAGYSAHRRSD